MDAALQTARHAHMKKALALLVALFAACSLLFALNAAQPTQAHAATAIKSAKQLRNLQKRGSGTYKITKSFTLGDTDKSTCRLYKGTFVIDFNGHTVQSAYESMATFQISGAKVTFMDSKAKKKNACIRSYSLGCFDVTNGGSLTIKSGRYYGVGVQSCAGSIEGGKLVIKKGFFYGGYYGILTAGGTFKLKGGTLRGGWRSGLEVMAGKVKLYKGTIRTDGEYMTFTDTYPHAICCNTITGAPMDLKKLLAKGHKFTSNLNQVYWNGNAQISATYDSLFAMNVIAYTKKVKVK